MISRSYLCARVRNAQRENHPFDESGGSEILNQGKAKGVFNSHPLHFIIIVHVTSCLTIRVILSGDLHRFMFILMLICI